MTGCPGETFAELQVALHGRLSCTDVARLVDGDTTPSRVLSRALGLLPPQERGRYLVEWAGDLAQLTSRRERLAFAAGVLDSAVIIARHSSPAAVTR